jgi:hypothetical protein
MAVQPSVVGMCKLFRRDFGEGLYLPLRTCMLRKNCMLYANTDFHDGGVVPFRVISVDSSFVASLPLSG